MDTAIQTPPVVIHDSVCEALITQFHEDGYAVLRDALTPDEVAGCNAEAVRLCRGELGEIGRAPAVARQ